MTSATGMKEMTRSAILGGLTRAVGRWAPLTWLAAASILMTGCSLDGILKSDELPPDVTDPAFTQTPEGAVAAYQGALLQFKHAFGGVHGSTAGSAAGFVASTGLLSDELRLMLPDNQGEATSADMRDMPEGAVNSGVYSRLHRVRGQAGQAIGLLTRFAPGRDALTGHAYAVQGYSEIFLAEFFCSGIPLSTLDFDGDFTYKPGSTTEEVFAHARALFDTALVFATDSTRFVHLARVGQARALLALGQFPEAAAAAAQVPDGYAYTVRYSPTGGTAQDTARNWNFARTGSRWELSVGDREGINGLDYRTSGDPRTRVTQRGTEPTFGPIFHPNKYAIDGASPIVLASGVEARLIEAEGALQTGGNWLDRLNALRTNGAFTTAPNPTDPTRTDTTWTAGTGGTAGLRPLADPGTPESRVDLLFRERAFWLFLTGQRQGDLRRLIRQYGRSQDQIYPVGVYPSRFGAPSYGSDVTVPIPPAERTSNPHFTGCASRDA